MAWFVIYVIIHGLYVGIEVSFLIRKLYVKSMIISFKDGFEHVQIYGY